MELTSSGRDGDIRYWRARMSNVPNAPGELIFKKIQPLLVMEMELAVLAILKVKIPPQGIHSSTKRRASPGGALDPSR